MIKKISHVVVYVSNMERSVEFYTQKLGLPLRSKSDHWSEVGGTENGVYVGIHYSNIPERDHRNSTDISFLVDDVLEVRKSLEERGIEFYDEITKVGPNASFTSFYDPDGNNLSIYQSG
ncbi:MAG: VOC family protein [Candidatus Kariarchaeaceae archaeon]